MLIRFSSVWLFATLWTVALQAPLSMGFTRQENWSGLLPPPGNLPDLCPLSHVGSPIILICTLLNLKTYLYIRNTKPLWNLHFSGCPVVRVSKNIQLNLFLNFLIQVFLMLSMCSIHLSSDSLSWAALNPVLPEVRYTSPLTLRMTVSLVGKNY